MDKLVSLLLISWLLLLPLKEGLGVGDNNSSDQQQQQNDNDVLVINLFGMVTGVITGFSVGSFGFFLWIRHLMRQIQF
ncbi:MAG: hypothetical protein LBL71_01745 [Endomicrobium sp.]|jgi:hypothetical protein|nr:hypothetical protein [Endomicrobium sp.]